MKQRHLFLVPKAALSKSGGFDKVSQQEQPQPKEGMSGTGISTPRTKLRNAIDQAVGSPAPTRYSNDQRTRTIGPRTVGAGPRVAGVQLINPMQERGRETSLRGGEVRDRSTRAQARPRWRNGSSQSNGQVDPPKTYVHEMEKREEWRRHRAEALQSQGLGPAERVEIRREYRRLVAGASPRRFARVAAWLAFGSPSILSPIEFRIAYCEAISVPATDLELNCTAQKFAEFLVQLLQGRDDEDRLRVRHRMLATSCWVRLKYGQHFVF
jgi:hypothetical protein